MLRVTDGLVQQGVVSNTVATIGLGETKPVATNGTAAGRQQNRRVELIVSGKSIGTRQLTTVRIPPHCRHRDVRR